MEPYDEQSHIKLSLKTYYSNLTEDGVELFNTIRKQGFAITTTEFMTIPVAKRSSEFSTWQSGDGKTPNRKWSVSEHVANGSVDPSITGVIK